MSGIAAMSPMKNWPGSTRGSVAFVYPSLSEGFGIPLLEAMSCGGVVVASNRSASPRSSATRVFCLDPTSTDELTDALISLLESPCR